MAVATPPLPRPSEPPLNGFVTSPQSRPDRKTRAASPSILAPPKFGSAIGRTVTTIISRFTFAALVACLAFAISFAPGE
jgi:hypothetical protein